MFRTTAAIILTISFHCVQTVILLHHQGNIPKESLRTWKLFLITLNEAFDKKSIDLLLALNKIGKLYVSGEGVLNWSALISANLVNVEREEYTLAEEPCALFGPWKIRNEVYTIELTERGKLLIEAWKAVNSNELLKGL